MTPGHRTIEMCVECAAAELRRIGIPGRYIVVLRLRKNCPSKVHALDGLVTEGV